MTISIRTFRSRKRMKQVLQVTRRAKTMTFGGIVSLRKMGEKKERNSTFYFVNLAL